MRTTVWNITGATTLALSLATSLALGLYATAQESGVETVEIKPAEKAPIIKPAEKAPIIKPADDAPVVQLALLLDTSGSMKGLIEQAKTQLWSVVNEFIAAKQNGVTPVVQVALYEYGKSSLPAESHWIRQIQPLTRDLDSLSRELFALQTNGGDEYCGAVIAEAARSLAWDASPNTYKAMFIAGNEPFTQGPVAPKDACKEAITKGIIVNTIHCGDEAAGISGGWKEGALLADGTFLVIDHNQAVAHIDAPQDAAILELNRELNGTYIAYGARGREALENQTAQDANAAGIAASNLVSRARTKASANYFNASWDIVDACQQKGFRWEEVKKEDLPEELQKLTTEELKAHVNTQLSCRADLQKRILTLTRERESYVASKRKELGEDQSLGSAVANAVKEQAAAKGVTFEGGK